MINAHRTVQKRGLILNIYIYIFLISTKSGFMLFTNHWDYNIFKTKVM